MADTKFHAVLVPEGGEPELHSFSTVDELVACLRSIPATTHGFCFLGLRLLITSLPWRFLMGLGEPIPLFDAPEPGEVDQSSRLGQCADEEHKDAAYASLVGTLPMETMSEEEVAGEIELPDK